MPSLDIPLPYHLELQSTLTQADTGETLLQNKPIFLLLSSNMSKTQFEMYCLDQGHGYNCAPLCYKLLFTLHFLYVQYTEYSQFRLKTQQVDEPD